MFATSDPGAEVKIIDFGLSKKYAADAFLHDTVGTVYTMAPELLRGADSRVNCREMCKRWYGNFLTVHCYLSSQVVTRKKWMFGPLASLHSCFCRVPCLFTEKIGEYCKKSSRHRTECGNCVALP
jgi:serine/threonine protein kinase